MGRILHPGACDAQLLHDTVQEPLNLVLRHLVSRAGATRRSPAELQAEEEAEEPEPRSGAKHRHLRGEKGWTSAKAATDGLLTLHTKKVFYVDSVIGVSSYCLV